MTYKLDGKRFGDLVVIKRSDIRNSRGKPLWLCKCDCGKDFLAVTNDLISGNALSCRKCNYHIEHKDAYLSWMGAKSRCLTPTNKDYSSYGGRGITIDIRWQKSFKFFLQDMGDPPLDPNTGERLSLDRVDNNGNYCKENCRWATRSQQQLNKNVENFTKDPMYKAKLKLRKLLNSRGEY